MLYTPPSTITSASAVFCTHTPAAPANICSLARATLLCVLAWGRQRTSCFLANSAMRPRFLFIASRSMTSAGVSMALTLWPTSWARSSETGVFVGGFIVQMLSIGPAYQSKAFGRPQQPVDRAIGQLPGAWRIHILSGRDPVQRVQHPAVRHHHDLLARMARSQRMHRAGHALAQLQQRLAPFGRRPVGEALAPVLRVVGPGLVDLGEGLALEQAEAALAQPFFGHDGRAGDFGYRLRRLVRATEIAGIDGADRLAGQRFADAARLPSAGLIQADVQLALDARVDVPGGFAMAYRNDSRSFHLRAFYLSSRTLALKG